MLSQLEKTKIYIEIIAIITAGLFAFFTWGLDYLSLSDPNWDMELIKVQELPAMEVNGVNQISPDVPTIEAKATSCVFEATLKILNKGKRPVTPGKTFVKIYFIKRFSLNDTVTNNSTYEYLKQTCELKETKEPCQIANDSFMIDEIDPQPIFPDNEGWRPLSIEINPNKPDSSKLLSDFTDKYVLLIVIKQSVVVKKIFRNVELQSKLVYLSPSICNMRNYIAPENPTPKNNRK